MGKRLKEADAVASRFLKTQNIKNELWARD